MKAIVLANTGNSLDVGGEFAEYFAGSKYAVQVGAEYAILAMTHVGGILCFFVMDDDREASCIPAGLFRITDPRIPAY